MKGRPQRTALYLALERLYRRLGQENAEASVALSHLQDCECELCQRVRARLGTKGEGDAG